MKKKTKNFFLDKFEEIHENQIINLFCFDTQNPNSENDCHLEIKAYPPIGSVIVFGNHKPSFKIESLEIQWPKGQTCIANGVFLV
ncbi:hypothetical protein [Flavobacterium muglaense]|jgi:hypothetical protein|uniref:Uncharacterized protein n=1 Tax=Flavobacterium muglaense TaxID=2764716 RepID=A0A923N1C1_9FLAO|nr:hypothetical protein [Flavobacterium muglaense]MBC5838746.1 hypothetical protein [Flavobacterium muglaense]MBC5838748.1 hypothetical protein [Flavobacterium muglaense]MBC5845220.1 hypothetical protein [Flavobacterium muglaense]MBC5845222.1 hypothetical protein [Flavobacterium muglaense]